MLNGMAVILLKGVVQYFLFFIPIGLNNSISMKRLWTMHVPLLPVCCNLKGEIVVAVVVGFSPD